MRIKEYLELIYDSTNKQITDGLDRAGWIGRIDGQQDTVKALFLPRHALLYQYQIKCGELFGGSRVSNVVEPYRSVYQCDYRGDDAESDEWIKENANKHDTRYLLRQSARR